MLEHNLIPKSEFILESDINFSIKSDNQSMRFILYLDYIPISIMRVVLNIKFEAHPHNCVEELCPVFRIESVTDFKAIKHT